jgi:Cys-tRNA(Pro)/Cys-tRNA(Cys) deacylase
VAKTNAARVLDGLGVAYELRSYEVDPGDLSAVTVAARVGLPPEQVFKTLVARGDRGGICLAVVPGDEQLDLKALARAAGDRRSELVPLREVQPLTGYVRGGVTALACKKEYPVFIDETAQLYPAISVSAGQRGLQILLAPDDYARAVRGRWAPLAAARERPGGMTT